MSDLVSVPLPLNMSLEESNLYMPFKTYEFPYQKVKYLKNVLITFSGFCINKNGLIKESHHNYPSQHYYYLNEASKYYHGAMDNPGSVLTLDEETTYLSIHHPWFNYYHWICESIFRLWMVKRKLDKFTLVLPAYYQDADFIKGSLEPFNLSKIYFIPADKSLLVKKLCLPQIKPICDSYNSLHIRQVRNFYRNYVKNKVLGVDDKIERLYVSRKLAGRRKVINEDEILTILYKHNFTIFYPEKHSFLEQVKIFSNTKYLIGEHGSGFTNMLFMSEGSSVLELHKNKTNELKHPSFLFWYLSEALQIKYYHQSCQTYGKEDYFEGDYIIDQSQFERNLIRMISKS